jgi:L-ribulose-5-phosphate 3-epimerase
MNNTPLTQRVAVCSWSLRPTSPQDLVAQLKATGLSRVQLALDPLRESPGIWGGTAALFRQHGITIVSGMFGCVGEDYTTLDSIRRTGGLTPDATWDQNWQNMQVTLRTARDLGVKLIAFHAGFLPHEESDPNCAKMRDRLARVADLFASGGIDLAFETGQETAGTLLECLEKLKRPNVGVNFDPANMILYDKGDPVEALGLLGPHVRGIHVKDARRTKVPGTWGEEVVVGTGEVDWKAFFATLARFKFPGSLCIEREAGEQRAADIRSARDYIEKFLG